MTARGTRRRIIRRIFRRPRGQFWRGIWRGLVGLHDELPLGLHRVGSFEGPCVRVMVGWNAGKSSGLWWLEEEEGAIEKQRRSIQSRGRARGGEGTSWPENRPGAEGHAPRQTIGKTRRGRTRRGRPWSPPGAVVDRPSLYLLKINN